MTPKQHETADRHCRQQQAELSEQTPAAANHFMTDRTKAVESFRFGGKVQTPFSDTIGPLEASIQYWKEKWQLIAGDLGEWREYSNVSLFRETFSNELRVERKWSVWIVMSYSYRYFIEGFFHFYFNFTDCSKQSGSFHKKKYYFKFIDCS